MKKIFLFLLFVFQTGTSFAMRPAIQGSMSIKLENGKLVFYDFVLRDIYGQVVTKDYIFRLESFYIIDSNVREHPANKVWGFQSIHQRYSGKVLPLPKAVVVGELPPETVESYTQKEMQLHKVYIAMGDGLAGDEATLYQPFCLLKNSENQTEVIILKDSEDECKQKTKWFFGLF